MRVEMTRRANIAYQNAEEDLKRRVSDVVKALETDSPLSSEQLRPSKGRPGVWIVKIDDYRLFFMREPGVVRILDIILRSEAYQ